MAAIATRWKALSGNNNWEGLLDPIDNDLRRYLIHYAERVEAVYDATNVVKTSKSYGFSRYPPERLFTEVNLENGNPFKYEVTKYFYLRSESNDHSGDSAWIGYVAVSTDAGSAILGRRDILVSWRGTVTDLEYWNDFQVYQTSAADIFGDTNNPMVHAGYHNIYIAKNSDFIYNKASAREQVLSEIRKLVNKYADEDVSITVTGHSLGAAVGTLNAMDIVANGYNKPSGTATGFPVTAFLYASPHVGDKGFKKVFSELSDLRILRIQNANDWVPQFPASNATFSYEVVGEVLKIDSSKSPYLKDLRVSPQQTNIFSYHQVEIYMHGIAGYQGEDKEFKLVVDRDIALVNKGIDGLLDKYKVPPTWWVVENSGMVQMDDGSWKLNDYVSPPPSDD